MKREHQNEDKKSLLKTLKLIGPSHIIILILLLAFNTYAWFIFNNKVSTGIDVHVSAWNIEFTVDSKVVEEDFSFDISKAQPGMDDFEKTIEIQNNSEVNAKITYEVEEVDIMTDKYVISGSSSTSTDGKTYTSDELIENLANNYPFKITFSFENNTQTIEKSGQGGVIISMKWPLDSGNDALDTEWGEKAYSFYKTNPDDPMIHILIHVKVEQDDT